MLSVLDVTKNPVKMIKMPGSWTDGVTQQVWHNAKISRFVSYLIIFIFCSLKLLSCWICSCEVYSLDIMVLIIPNTSGYVPLLSRETQINLNNHGSYCSNIVFSWAQSEVRYEGEYLSYSVLLLADYSAFQRYDFNWQNEFNKQVQSGIYGWLTQWAECLHATKIKSVIYLRTSMRLQIFSPTTDWGEFLS